MISEMPFYWADEELILTPCRSVYYPKESAVIIADLHLGKTTHFRKHGIGIPKNIADSDLETLTEILEHFSAEKLIIAGDFFHADENSELDLFHRFRTEFENVDIILVKGNHDRLRTKIYSDFSIRLIKGNMVFENFGIAHDYDPNSKKPQISGHLHPGVFIKGRGRQYLKFPAFVYNSSNLILPAFSRFTGLYTRFPKDKFQYIAVLDKALLQV